MKRSYFIVMKELKKLLGARIKELRKERNLTQEQFAELLNIDFRSLSHIECGDTFPSKNLAEIASAFHMSISELLNFEHHKYTIAEMKEQIRQNLDYISDKEIITIFRLITAMR